MKFTLSPPVPTTGRISARQAGGTRQPRWCRASSKGGGTRAGWCLQHKPRRPQDGLGAGLARGECVRRDYQLVTRHDFVACVLRVMRSLFSVHMGAQPRSG